MGCSRHREIAAPLCLALDHGQRQNVMPDYFVLRPGVDSGQLAVGASPEKRPGPGSRWGHTVWWHGTPDSMLISFLGEEQSTRYYLRDINGSFQGVAFGEIHIVFTPGDTASFHSFDTTAVTARPLPCDSLPLGVPEFAELADTK